MVGWGVAELKTKEKSSEETETPQFLLWGNLELNLCSQALQGFIVALSYVLSLKGLWGR